MKKLRIGLLMVCVLLSFSACGEKQQMRVSILDIGKADAILITSGEYAVLMDAGTNEMADKVLLALEKNGIERLDALILTHFDEDHIGAADEVMEKLDVDLICQPDYEKQSEEMTAYQNALENYSGEVITVTSAQRLSLDGLEFVISPAPDDGKVRSSNDHSLVTELRYGETSFLLPGDAEKLRLHDLIDNQIGHFDVLKMPHHGIPTTATEEFLSTVKPDYVVVTVPYADYADAEIIAQLKALGTQIHYTNDGMVTYISDGEMIEVVQ